MKKILREASQWCLHFLLIIASVFIALAILLPVNIPPVEVQAGSGMTAEFMGVNGVYDDGRTARQYKDCTWSAKRGGNGNIAAQDQDLTVRLDVVPGGGTDCPNGEYVWTLWRCQMNFDTSSLPDDCFIWGAELRLKVASYYLDAEFPYHPRVVLTPGTGQAEGVPLQGDYQKFGDTLLSVSEMISGDMIGDYVYLQFTQAGLDYINVAGCTQFKLRDYIWDALNNDPLLYLEGTGAKVQSCGFDYVEDATEADRPRLFVYYGDTPIVRSETQNPDNAAEGGAGGNVDAIDWKTVRCAYADEELGFRVSGDAGEEIDLELRDSTGKVIDSISDSIRQDGFFYWRAACGLGDTGFVKCVETNSSVESEWGYIANTPSASEIHNYTYARFTDYPQYDVAFSNYIANSSSVMEVHWKTDIQDDELDDYSLRLYHLGDSADCLYNKTLADMLDDYYHNCYAPNDFQAGWRYTLFAFDPADNWTGLLIDLDRGYISANTGFYQGLIYKEGDSEYSITHSAYCYLYDLDGIVLTLDEADYNANEAMTVFVKLDDETGWAAMWDSWRACWVATATGGEYEPITGSLTQKEFDITGLEAPASIGNYEVRVTFYKEGAAGNTFDYTHDIPFTVGGGKKDTVSKIEDLFEKWGLGGAAGKWIICVILMALCFIAFHQSKLLRVVMPMMVFGVFLVAGWLDIWVVVLLALGVGVSIFFLFRRGHGSKEEG